MPNLSMKNLEELVLGKHIAHLRARNRMVKARTTAKRPTFIALRMGGDTQHWELRANDGWIIHSCLVNTVREKPVVRSVSMKRERNNVKLTLWTSGGHKVAEIIASEVGKFPHLAPFDLVPVQAPPAQEQ